MKFKMLCLAALIAFAVSATSAQTTHTFSGKCSKPDVLQNVPAGDKDGHFFTLGQGKCSATGEVGGAAAKDGSFSEHGEMSANNSKAWGLYTENYDGGDKVYYSYMTTASMKAGVMTTGSNKYQIIGGTGKMKGIKGSGTCKLTGTADGGLDYSCSGIYTLAAAAPMK